MEDCNKCIFATRDGGCTSWDCEFIDKQEAYEAWKAIHCGQDERREDSK